jgi:biotin operon repressor
MSDKKINERYSITDHETGEIMTISEYQAKTGRKWEKANIHRLESMFRDGSRGEAARVVGFFLINKDVNNRVSYTQQEIAEELKITPQTVNKVIKRLEKNGYIKQLRHSLYLVDPDVTYYGDKFNRLKILDIWNRKRK